MKNFKIAGFIASLIIVVIIPLSVFKFHISSKLYSAETKPQFVGVAKCVECHRNEYNSWKDSHHAHAMEIASDETVLGDFNNAELIDGDKTHRFYRKDGKFLVFTEGPEGEMREFEISHTFGYTPLQQYLIPFEKGKYQCLHLSWDTEKKKWFNLSKMIYGETIHHNDWLHWTNQAQNWNGMCAECHSTNLNKNYISKTDSFNTTFSEINVSCEACHGPGSEHLKWASLPESSRTYDGNYGLAVKTSSINNEQYVDICARCHSRRGQFKDFRHEFRHIYDYMQPSTLNENFHPDGQILEEDYVYASFLQSKMYRTDVKCNDCHDVHSGERLLDGNALCYQCHNPDYYGSGNHHFHKLKGEPGEPLNLNGKVIDVGEGALCVNCHMPGQYYMGIDFRNDHSIRIPRPDLTEKIGTPNACNQCHTDKDVKWAINYFQKWYGIKNRPHYGEVLAAGRMNSSEAKLPLIRLANDTLSPLIARATAIELLGNYASDSAYLTIKKYLDDPYAMLRHAAIAVYNNTSLQNYVNDIAPLLNDPYAAVRGQAAFKLTFVPRDQIPERYERNFKQALKEYRESNEYAADFSGGRLNLGILYSNTGQLQQAKHSYQMAIKIDSAFVPAKINLASIHNRVGENKEAEMLYREIITGNPDYSEVYYSLGLLLAEDGNYSESAKYMEIAYEKSPENTRALYNLSLVYQRLEKFDKAENRLLRAIEIDPKNFDYLYAIAHFYINNNKFDKARKMARKLKKQFPGNQTGNQLIDYIERTTGAPI
ncbi:MAG: tetratricopeptide repeat protein [Cytophagales bacterium]|nr:tetratricopeptide repeat protein [Cytophagales bacterium]